MHEQRERKHGSVGVAATVRQRGRTCSVDGCHRKNDSHGMCGMHRLRVEAYGEPGQAKSKRAGGACSFLGCEKKLVALGLCGGHYRQQERGVELSPLIESWRGKVHDRDDDGNKQCRQCRHWFPEPEFARSGRMSDGVGSYCGKCRRARALWTHYRITIETYDALLASQGGGCLVCGIAESPDGRAFHVDHDHACCSDKRSCGKCIRGLLCSRCNLAIGLFEDSPIRLSAAAVYIAQYARDRRVGATVATAAATVALLERSVDATDQRVRAAVQVGIHRATGVGSIEGKGS